VSVVRAPSGNVNSGFSDAGHTEGNFDTERYVYEFNTYTFYCQNLKTAFNIISTYVYRDLCTDGHHYIWYYMYVYIHIYIYRVFHDFRA